MLQDYMDSELVCLHPDFPDQKSLFRFMTKKLCEKGFVTEQYYDSLMAREQNFPTGLSMGDYFVAIPHGGCESIRKEFVGVVVLARPVQMRQMDAPTCEIPVEYVFFLGLKSEGNHMKMLKEVVKIIKNRSLVLSLKDIESPKNLIALIAQETERNLQTGEEDPS